MKVFFYGASVTAQKGPSGYVERVKELFAGSKYDVSALGYGACHLDDAGFYNFKEVIDRKPDVCVMEWNTTGLAEFNNFKIMSMINEARYSNINIAFLILPRTDTNLNINRKAEIQIKKLAEAQKVPLLDLRYIENISECLRDNVHTNSYGAVKYANAIYNWVIGMRFVEFGIFPQSVEALTSCFEANFLVNRNFRKTLTLDFLKGDVYEIVFEMIVGPSMVDLVISWEGRNTEKSFVDPWCYYERKMYHVALHGKKRNPNVSEKLHIMNSLATPNFSILKLPPDPSKQYLGGLLISKIYSLGVVISAS